MLKLAKRKISTFQLPEEFFQTKNDNCFENRIIITLVSILTLVVCIIQLIPYEKAMVL